MTKRILLASPRGFCAGVVRAIDSVHDALSRFGAPIYVKHEIVHNRIVVDNLRKKGAIFIEDLRQIPKGSIVIFSAHGVSPMVKQQAKDLGLKLIDATCGLVTRVHSAITRYAKKGYQIILIGHKNHVEIQGSFGHAPDVTTIVESVNDVDGLNYAKDQKLFMITQTTLSLLDVEPIFDAIKSRFSQVESLHASSICYATTNRQLALKELCEQADLALIVGDCMSSNSKRLVELAKRMGVVSYLIQSANQISRSWVEPSKVIAVSAGASTPEDIVQSCILRLKQIDTFTIESFSKIEENVTFALPKVTFRR